MTEVQKLQVKRRPAGIKSIRAKYDAAQTTPNNARHWANADGLSAAASNSEAVRHALRIRSRYEIANDTIASGIVDTLVNDTVGTGPRIQIGTRGGRSPADEKVENKFREWAKKNGLSWKTRVARRSKIASGEVFVLLIRGAAANRRGSTLFATPEPELGIQLIEADQVASPQRIEIPQEVSGIEFDSYGNPIAYHILKEHPGANTYSGSLEAQRLPASMVLHWFNRQRPGDARGIPEITPALELFAMRRRYMLATVEAAEHLANIAGIMQTDAPADGEATESGEDETAFDTVDFARGQILTLPYGWKYTQADAKNPTATFVQFQHELIGQLARCLNMPFNIAAGNSSSYNYASGRLDHQTYRKTIEVERAAMIDELLDPIFWAWFDEATLIEGYLPQAARSERYRRDLESRWFFDGSGHVDPVKEAQGQKLRLENGSTTLAIEAAREGHDWRDIARQRKEESEFYRELGIPAPGTAPAGLPPGASQTPPEDEEDQEVSQDQDNPAEGRR